MAEQAGGGVDMDSLRRPRFASPQRYDRWIRPLRTMDKKQMPHDLFCFATRYLVEEARAMGLPDITLVQDLPDWLTIDDLVDTGNQVSHGVFIAMAERLKEAKGNPSPVALRTAAYHAAHFDDWVTNMVRRVGSVKFAMGATSFMGNLVTKDQHVDARETRRENGTRKGRTIHYYLEPEEGTYVEQGTFTRGYYEVLTRLWSATARAPLVAVRDAALRFSPEKLLRDEFDYARQGLGIESIERDREGNLRFNDEIVGRAVDPETLHRQWVFEGKYVRHPSRPVQMVQPIVFNGEEIFAEGLVLGAPASVYEWSYEKLPPVNRAQVFIQGMHDRFFVSSKHLRASYERVSQERDRANERGEEAERQKAIAEQRAATLQQLITGMAHEYRNLLGRVQLRARGLELYLADTNAPEEQQDAAHLVTLESMMALETSEGLRALTVAQPPVEVANLGIVVNDVATIFLNDPKYRDIEVRFKGEEVYEAEVIKGTFYTLVANLMTNAGRAMKYGAEGRTKIEITLAREIRYGVAGVTLTVKDEGCGMEPERQERYKAGKLPAGSEESNGTGHKLIMDIARAHNKNHPEQGLYLESEVGQGTRVQVFLPEHYQR